MVTAFTTTAPLLPNYAGKGFFFPLFFFLSGVGVVIKYQINAGLKQAWQTYTHIYKQMSKFNLSACLQKHLHTRYGSKKKPKSQMERPKNNNNNNNLKNSLGHFLINIKIIMKIKKKKKNSQMTVFCFFVQVLRIYSRFIWNYSNKIMSNLAKWFTVCSQMICDLTTKIYLPLQFASINIVIMLWSII